METGGKQRLSALLRGSLEGTKQQSSVSVTGTEPERM